MSEITSIRKTSRSVRLAGPNQMVVGQGNVYTIVDLDKLLNLQEVTPL